MWYHWCCVIGWLCISSSSGKIIDLTYPFDNATHYWLASEQFNLTEVFRGVTDNNFYYEANQFAAQEHGGTHLDAPSHFHRGGWRVADIPPERFIAHAVVLDISDRADADPDAVVTVQDVQEWKRQHGPLRYPTVVLVKTGYARRWGDRDAYFGTTSTAGGASAERHFPGVGVDAARALAADAAVVGVGIDTASIDAGRDALFPAHRTLAAQNIYHLENVRDLSQVPASGATVIALPMLIAGGSGAPCRILVQLPDA